MQIFNVPLEVDFQFGCSEKLVVELLINVIGRCSSVSILIQI